ncbi:hypothetical protein HDU82_004282 [Entophlyctis luteolus]|nr:hypothetical protein HDU82_004282 [Entophlyctis luteolus]
MMESHRLGYAAAVCEQDEGRTCGMNGTNGALTLLQRAFALDEYAVNVERQADTGGHSNPISHPMPHSGNPTPDATAADASALTLANVQAIQDVANSVAEKSKEKSAEIKNRGRLNKRFYYFIAGKNQMPVSGLDSELSDDSKTKYFTVAADMIVFSHSMSHVLMVFRCPHVKSEGHKCADGVLDKSSFQYKGSLATPGVRELNEECDKLLDEVVETKPDVMFVGPEFNNFRDIRWFTSSNYVPALAPQFATVLPEFVSENVDKSELPSSKRLSFFWSRKVHKSRLPKIKGTDDACGNAYWIDYRIIERVYRKYRKVYDGFDRPFEEDAFQEFIQENFSLENGKPVNKLKKDNSLLKKLKENEYVVAFDPHANYQFNDFAFDHVKNIVKAHDLMFVNDSSQWKQAKFGEISVSLKSPVCALSSLDA